MRDGGTFIRGFTLGIILKKTAMVGLGISIVMRRNIVCHKSDVIIDKDLCLVVSIVFEKRANQHPGAMGI